MRVTNSTKEYIRKEVWKKAEAKYSELKKKREAAKDVLKEIGKKFMSEQKEILDKAKADVMKLVKKYGLTFRYGNENNCCLLFNDDHFNELCSYDRHSKEYDKAVESVENFKEMVNHKIGEIVFRLECGGKAADVIRLIEEVKF